MRAQSNIKNYWNENKEEILFKVNGFLLVVLVATLITIWNVRVNSATYDYVDEEQKLEQVKEEVVEDEIDHVVIENDKVLHFDNFSNTSSIDEDYEKIYPYYTHYILKNGKDETSYDSKTVRSSKELSNLVYFDAHSNSYTCILNRINSRLNFSRNSIELFSYNLKMYNFVELLSSVNLPPFIWIKARSPGFIFKSI